MAENTINAIEIIQIKYKIFSGNDSQERSIISFSNMDKNKFLDKPKTTSNTVSKVFQNIISQ